MQAATICAVLPTYNRRDKVEIAIRSILAQSRTVDRLLIVDNACTDATADFLREIQAAHPIVEVFTLGKNIGASGAYFTGIKKATEDGYDLIWTLDDDAYPDPECLAELLKMAVNLPSWSYLCSHVVRPDGASNQIPHLYTGVNACACPDWAGMLHHGAVRVQAATWNSCLIHALAVKAVGYPFRDFVMWAEDIEYTERLAGYAPAYFCGKSRIVHDTPSRLGHGILRENDERRIKLYFYFYRNLTFMRRRAGQKKFLLSSMRTLAMSAQCLLARERPFLRAKAVVTGWWAGLKFAPTMERWSPPQNS